MTILRAKTIALDTSFLVGLADARPGYERLRELLRERMLLPVICREQLEEMTKGSKERGIKLLAACDSPVFELPPFYYIMEAEAYAQLHLTSFDRSGLVSHTQWEALKNLSSRAEIT